VLNWRDLDHPQVGGAEVYCEQVGRRMSAMGERVVLLTSRVAGRPRRETRAGIEIVRAGGQFGVYPAALVWLFLRRHRVRAVVDSQNGIPFFSPLVVGRRTPVALLVHHVHQDQFGTYFNAPVAAVGRWLERVGSRLVYGERLVLAVSPSTRQGARLRLGLRGQVFVVPPAQEAPPGPAARTRPRHEQPRIVCVGRLVNHKRPSTIVEAVAQVLQAWPGLELHFVGGGPEAPALAALTQRLNVQKSVTFHGPLAAEARDDLLRTAWLTVVASQGEGWGLTVMEANALGVPVVARRVPGLRDSVLDGRTGWLVDEGDELAPAISQALAHLSDPRRAQAMALECQHWASHFNWDSTTERIAALLAAERGRLAHSGDDRRAYSDLAMVAQVPLDILPEDWAPRFRATDEVTIGPEGLLVLLYGTDLASAREALERAGLSRKTAGHHRVQIRVARPGDFVFPSPRPAAAAAISPHRSADDNHIAV
ncbi:MAG TPA: glycosyltransferase family 4 protein, partial [Acidimicrobiales bacterium]|nr:glycosyltransferase family 4 protein [Acidimicrobiales bacterium]